MCIFSVSSTNPNFSWIISKNPSGGMVLKQIRKGMAYGYFHQSNNIPTYIIFFRDLTTEISYKSNKDDKFDYVNVNQYTSPIFVTNVLTEFFNQTINKKNDIDTDEYQCEIVINLVYMNNQAKNICTKIFKYFPNIAIELIQLVDKHYKIIIRSTLNLHTVFNFTYMIFNIISLLNSGMYDANIDMIEKMIRSVNIVDAPYYVRYIISSRLINSKKIFEQVKKNLEMFQKQKINLNFGNTAVQRKDYIESRITFNNPIIDIGCGEGSYAIPFAKKLVKTIYKYYAIDTDQTVCDIVKKKAIDNNLDNLIIMNSHEDLYHTEIIGKPTVIITEVIEHMDEANVKNLIIDIMNKIDYTKIIITTPNYEFNVNYNMEHQYRHPDHQRELTTEQFKEFMTEILLKFSDISYQYVGIGDSVDDIFVTQGIIIIKN